MSTYTMKTSYITRHSKKKRKLSLRVIFSFILAIFIIILSLFFILKIYTYLTTTSFFSIKHIKIYGNKILTDNDIKSFLNLNLGDNLLSINISELNYKLYTNNWIKSCLIKRELPDTITIYVEEKEPCFLLLDNDNNIFYADINGNKISKVYSSKYISLPILKLRTEMDKNILKNIIVAFKEKRFPFSLDQVQHIVVDSFQTEFFIKDIDTAIFLENNDIRRESIFLSKVISDLSAKRELNKVNRIIVIGNKIWVSYRRHFLKP
ncbi:cell division protein FtsQ [Desulfonauticus submarinus]|uniref:Cell division protein FtsQ n=1 Tax=Desulfonauticus submarinus TaxID=206665 RepID=A0A1H0CTI9_9BACT|nr:FtsQ-type POTRA domain-containing protein [Desulfonauticus submarinus]SDN61184.1 cell division protein FtsQ [Desulfonauticus submarinus]